MEKKAVVHARDFIGANFVKIICKFYVRHAIAENETGFYES